MTTMVVAMASECGPITGIGSSHLSSAPAIVA
jgi:hypothetical protein